MKTLIALLAWCILLVLSWPLALLALVLWPIAWLLALPFRLVGITFTALFAFLGALLMLPARLLRGWRVGQDRHRFARRCRAGRQQSPRRCILHRAHTAAASGMKPLAMAENRNLDARTRSRVVHGRGVKYGDGYSVDGH